MISSSRTLIPKFSPLVLRTVSLHPNRRMLRPCSTFESPTIGKFSSTVSNPPHDENAIDLNTTDDAKSFPLKRVAGEHSLIG